MEDMNITDEFPERWGVAAYRNTDKGIGKHKCVSFRKYVRQEQQQL